MVSQVLGAVSVFTVLTLRHVNIFSVFKSSPKNLGYTLISQ